MRFTRHTNKIIALCLSFAITLSLYAPFINHNLAKLHPTLSHLEVPKAYAQLAVIDAAKLAQDAERGLIDAGNFVKNTLNEAANFITAGGTITILGKEFGLDTIAWYLAKAVVRSMTRSIVNWINSGFEGGPTFLTDLQGFLLDTADFAVEQFLQGSDIEFICSPFRLDVKIAIAIQHSTRGTLDAQCTIDGIVSNVENFLNGAFAEGGFRGWLEISQNPQNTRAGAFLEANAMARLRVLDAQGREVQMLSFGEGFFSTTFCEFIEEEENCIVEVPGQIIEEQLTHVLGSGLRTAELADEIGESIGVIFSSLVGFTLQSGLAALSSALYGDGLSGAGSYLDALVAEGNTSSLPQVEGQMEEAIRNEESYIEIYLDIINIIDDLTFQNEAGREAARIIVRETNGGETTEREVACYALELPSDLAALEDRARSIIPLGEAALLVLADQQNRLAATSSPEAQNEILNEFLPLQTGTARIELEPAELSFLNNLLDQYDNPATTAAVRQNIVTTLLETGLVTGLHNEIEIARAEVTDLRETEAVAADFEAAIAAEIARCRAVADDLRNSLNNR